MNAFAGELGALQPIGTMGKGQRVLGDGNETVLYEHQGTGYYGDMVYGGVGFITFDTGKKTYFIESYRFLIDATDGKPSNQFTGWPATIHQRENGGESLPTRPLDSPSQ